MYSNPKIPEGINTSKEHPLKEFSILLIGTLVLIAVLTFVLGFFGSYFAGKIPFSAEVKIASLYDVPGDANVKESSNAEDKLKIDNENKLKRYLQNLADKIAKAQKLPEEMKIIVHYVDGDTVNAFATLGGNLILYRGLLKKLPNENALTMLLGHEIAHVKYRHPIKSMGRGVAAGIAIAAITGSTNSSALGETGLLTTLHYSRKMEQQSDEEAMQTLNTLYGHINGGAQLFKEFQKMREQENSSESPALFSSHPLDQQRIDNFERMAALKQWQTSGTLTPLPDFFSVTH